MIFIRILQIVENLFSYKNILREKHLIIHRKNKLSYSYLQKLNGRRYSAETITEADSTDNQVLLANTPAQG